MPRVDPKIRREEIIKAALALFQRDGFDSVKVEAILHEVGLSKGGFYHHFKSREDILRQIVISETGDLVDDLQESLVGDDSIAALANLFIRGSANLGADAGVLNTLSSFASRSVYLDELEKQLALLLKPHVTTLIKLGVERKVFRDVDCDATAEIIFAVNEYANRSAILGSLSGEQLHAYSQTAIEALARHLGIDGQLQRQLLSMASAD